MDKTTQSTINSFLAQRKLALAGVSRARGKFGNAILKELPAKGYEIYPIHPEAAEIDGVRCYHSLAELPSDIGGLILCVPPAATEKLVREAADRGLTRIWMQSGAESDAALSFCSERGLEVVHGECILMFAAPLGWFHGVHRALRRLFGRMPQ